MMAPNRAGVSHWRPCSNYASLSTIPPLPYTFLPPYRGEVAPLKPARGSGECCKLPEWGPGWRPQLHFAALYASKKHLFAAFLVSLVSIAMSGKMKAILESPCNLQNSSHPEIGDPVRLYILNMVTAGPAPQKHSCIFERTLNELTKFTSRRTEWPFLLTGVVR